MRYEKLLHTALLIAFISVSSADISCVVNGVNNQSLLESTRFYDSGKGFYWQNKGVGKPGSAYFEEYKKHFNTETGQGDVSFMGELASFITDYNTNTNETLAIIGLYNLTGDDQMCWAYTSSNVVQYWLNSYGVFYNKAQEKGDLAYGYTYDKQYLQEFGGTQSLSVSEVYRQAHKNVGASARGSFRWYFSGNVADNGAYNGTNTGGYFKDYFTNISADANITLSNASNTRSLATSFATGLGMKIHDDLSVSTEVEGRISYLSIGSGGDSNGHALTCYGMNLNSDGSLKSILCTNSDDMNYGLIELFVKHENGNYVLYVDENLTTKWTYSNNSWYLRSLTYIDTPEVLQNMLKEYKATNNAIVWSGQKQTWGFERNHTYDELPDTTTGWQIYAGTGSDYASYYDAYYDPSRMIEFNDSAKDVGLIQNIEVQEQVTAAEVNVHNEVVEYKFQGSQDHSVNKINTDSFVKDGVSSATFSNVEVFATSTQWKKGNVYLESGSVWISQSIVTDDSARVIINGNSLIDTGSFIMHSLSSLIINGAELKLKADSASIGNLDLFSGSHISYIGNDLDFRLQITGNLCSFIDSSDVLAVLSTNRGITIDSHLDLTLAQSISLQQAVSLNGNDLFLKDFAFLLENSKLNDVWFENVGDLYVDGVLLNDGSSISVGDIFTDQGIPNQFSKNDRILYYNNQLFVVSIPEPSSSILMLIGVGSLLWKRRRRN